MMYPHNTKLDVSDGAFPVFIALSQDEASLLSTAMMLAAPMLNDEAAHVSNRLFLRIVTQAFGRKKAEEIWHEAYPGRPLPEDPLRTEGTM